MSKNNNKIFKYLIAFFVIMALSFIYKLLFKGDASGIIYASKPDDTTTNVTTELIPTITSGENTIVSIYICGAVNSPGVYAVPSGAILNDVILMADGFDENAASDYINLVYELSSNMSIYIPTYEEIRSGMYSDGIIYRSSNEDYQWGIETAEVEPATTYSGLININTATQDELTSLPGIGESTAAAIISYREANRFESIEDIMNVAGIGESKFSRIQNLITVD